LSLSDRIVDRQHKNLSIINGTVEGNRNGGDIPALQDEAANSPCALRHARQPLKRLQKFRTAFTRENVP
jgi:hypothetical protein